MLPCATAVGFCGAPEKGVENSAPANAALPRHNRMFGFITLPHVRGTSRSPSGSRRPEPLAALRTCTTAYMATTRQMFRAPAHFVQIDNTLLCARRGRKLPPRKSNTIRAEKFRALDKFSANIQKRTHSSLLVPPFDFPGSPNKFFDLTLARIPT